MNRRMIATLVLWIGASVGSGAHAAITAFWQQATITPTAIANDPALVNMESWDLMVTTTGDWHSAQMGAALPPGLTFYKHPLGGLTRPDPGLFGSSPALEFTTFVSSAGDNGTNNNTVILGGHPQGTPISLGDATSPRPGTFSMVWGGFGVDLAGTYQIARLTFPTFVLPGIFSDPFDPSTTAQVSPDAVTIIPQIPEPGELGLLALGALLAIRRRMNLNPHGKLDRFGLVELPGKDGSYGALQLLHLRCASSPQSLPRYSLEEHALN